MQRSEESRKSKGEYELEEGKKGTIYDKYEIGLLKPLLSIKTKFWNPNYEFVSWEELFSKMDKINSILEKIGNQRDEIPVILPEEMETIEQMRKREDEIERKEI